MKEYLVKFQIALVIIVAAMLFNFVIESVLNLFGLSVNVNHVLSGSVVALFLVSLILKLNVWKQ